MVGTGKLSCIDDEITVNTDIADVEYSSLISTSDVYYSLLIFEIYITDYKMVTAS